MKTNAVSVTPAANGEIREPRDRRPIAIRLPRAAPTLQERNIEAARRYVETCNEGSDEAVDQCWVPEGVAVWFRDAAAPGGGGPGGGLPDGLTGDGAAGQQTMTIGAVMAAGEWVVAVGSIGAIAAADRRGLPPPAGEPQADRVLVWRFRDGLIVSEHIYGG